MKVIKVEPLNKPEVVEINGDLTSLQDAVGGYIEVVYPFEELVALICDEEGKLNAKPLNRALRDEDGDIVDIVAGTFLIAGLDDEDFCSLTDAQIEKFTKMFEKPEVFVKRADGSICTYTI